MSPREQAWGKPKPRPLAAYWLEEPAASSAVGCRARPSAASPGVRVRGGESVCCGLVVLAAAVEAAGNGAVGSRRRWPAFYLTGATVGAGRARRYKLPWVPAEAEGDVGACTWRGPAALAPRRGRCHGDSLSRS